MAPTRTLMGSGVRAVIPADDDRPVITPDGETHRMPGPVAQPRQVLRGQADLVHSAQRLRTEAPQRRTKVVQARGRRLGDQARPAEADQVPVRLAGLHLAAGGDLRQAHRAGARLQREQYPHGDLDRLDALAGRGHGQPAELTVWSSSAPAGSRLELTSLSVFRPVISQPQVPAVAGCVR